MTSRILDDAKRRSREDMAPQNHAPPSHKCSSMTGSTMTGSANATAHRNQSSSRILSQHLHFDHDAVLISIGEEGPCAGTVTLIAFRSCIITARVWFGLANPFQHRPPEVTSNDQGPHHRAVNHDGPTPRRTWRDRLRTPATSCRRLGDEPAERGGQQGRH